MTNLDLTLHSQIDVLELNMTSNNTFNVYLNFIANIKSAESGFQDDKITFKRRPIGRFCCFVTTEKPIDQSTTSQFSVVLVMENTRNTIPIPA